MVERIAIWSVAVFLAGCAGAARASGGGGGAASHAEHEEHAAPPAGGPRATQAFRDAHAALAREIDATEREAVALASTAPGPAEAHLRSVVQFFVERLEPHAAAEEAVLYTAADRLVAAPAPYRYTDGLRHDHGVIGAEIARLRAFAAGSDRSPEALATFWTRALGLLGAVRMHFAAEEGVVLELFDRRMSAAQFAREVMEPMERGEAAHGGGAHGHGHEHGEHR